jgi:RimJ/RimL family protein N-acetyltransferase
MGWNVTSDLESYVAEAGDFLRADPVENTVPLSVIDTLRAQSADAFGPTQLFGWWESGGRIRGTFLLTGTYPLLLSAMPEHAAAELAGQLADRKTALPGINASAPAARTFTVGWERHTGVTATTRMRQRLFRLGDLKDPRPLPTGTPRVATATDHHLVRHWFTAFEEESHGAGQVTSALIDDRLGYGGVTLWEAGGRPVALAGRTRVASGMTRIGPVYTPPEHRRRGYGAAVTATLTRSALDAGAGHVVLFTDLANPTSNGIYERLGFRPVSDRLVLDFRSPRYQ